MAEKRTIHEAHVEKSASYRCMIAMLETLIEEMKSEEYAPSSIASLVRCAYAFQNEIFIDKDQQYPCMCGCGEEWDKN
jgi:hypothetical protein